MTGTESGRIGDDWWTPVADDQWSIVAWLWQAFRNELATVTNAYPTPDGRYRATALDACPSPDVRGYLLWHRLKGEAVPVGFIVLRGFSGPERSILAFWVAPVARRAGIGRRFAVDVLSRHPGPWAIAFQTGNRAAAAFWPAVADELVGPGHWRHESRPVPGRPELPPDEWIRFRGPA